MTIILVILLILVVTLFLVRRYAMTRSQAAREQFPNARLIIPSANFYGQESLGVMQARGNGTLVLTDKELYFERWLPRREYRIPLAAIQAIETPSSYLGKTNFRPVLKIVFKDENGQTDSMGWLVSDVAGTQQAIEAARR
jgi:hypothetical protein